MSESKTVEMSEKMAVEIAEKFFEVIRLMFRAEPVRFSCEESRRTTIISFNEQGVWTRKEIILHKIDDDEANIVDYKVLYKGKIYRVEVLDNEDMWGYYSCLPVVDRARYVFCSIAEEREDGNIKCEMDFAFDIEKGTFLELFAIEHHNKCDITRECQCVDHIEQILSGRQIMDVYTE